MPPLYLLRVRTTIHIDDDLLVELAKAAADTSNSLNAIVQNALREYLYKSRKTERAAVDLPVFHGTGLVPGVNVNNTTELLDFMSTDNGID